MSELCWGPFADRAAKARFLITGAHGCVGAWVVHELINDNARVTTFDLSEEPRRLRLLLGDRADEVNHVVGNITDSAAIDQVLEEQDITNIIHLAALQVPLVRADPPLGARVNVLGTVNVFEAAARRELAPVVYASSMAVYTAEGRLDSHPGTLYGVFKRTNEATAAVYYTESGVKSVGLRPHTVYGVGRDQGLTSAPTLAMLAAAAGRPYAIPYGGVAQMQYVRDVARAFIGASVSGADGAAVYNLPGRSVAIDDVVTAILNVAPEAPITCGDVPLPFPGEVDALDFTALVPTYAETMLADGVRATIHRFRELLRRGAISPPPPVN